MRARWTIPAAALLLAGLWGAPAHGTQVKIFQTQSQAGFLAGTLEGVSVDSLGRMALAPRAERVASPGEPFLLAAAVHPDGWVIGTGNAGKVLLIDRKGEIRELFAAPEPEVFAVWADPDGTVYAGTSPRGKVYRIPKGGQGSVFFDPGETYIWSLVRVDAALLVGTGTDGKLFRVDAKGQGEVLYDSDDTHVRAVEPLPGGDLLLGTAGEGLILRIAKDGTARTLYDAEEPEVVALSAAADGGFYAAVVSSEASLVDLSKNPAAPAAPAAPRAQGGQAQVTVTPEGDPAAAGAASGTRREGAAGPRSRVLHVSPAGVVESLWSYQDETVYDVLARDGRVWVATGLEGKLYRYADSQMLLEKDVDERQIVALLPGDPGPAFATTNAAAFYRITAGTEAKGTYTSAVLDADQVARFGTFHWRGDVPAGTAVRFSFRSGVSAEPDRTWSPWTAPREGRPQDREVPLDGVPVGRYVQWRAELTAGRGGSPRLYGTELSYRQENLGPKIESLTALDPGQILVPTSFNPSNQVYEPAHPNRDGIFTTLALAPDDGGGRTKPLWKKGFQTLRWRASDPNQDALVYALAFRPAGTDGAEAGDWLLVTEDLKEDYYSFDATALPDGVYRFRLQATDGPSNDPESALVSERVSDPVVIDHSPPELGRRELKKGKDGKPLLEVTVRDAASPLREARVSVNAGEWKPVRAADGLLDGRSEVLWIEPGAAGDLVLLQVTDAANNVMTFNLTQDR